ncbi:MAG: DUF1501 domain-containing protein [Dokdonella sp.]|uniref:DUF1501 domain-containing protein n=1 Tax=Dokdonella sp. TaxID=2291710 RepID=UPI0032654588
MTTSHSRNRRDFLRDAACATLAAASGSALFSQMRLINSALGASLACPGYPPVDDYKALVCVFLTGGNDSFNLLVPNDAQRYSVYSASRGAMAIARDQLLPINVQNGLSGQAYGLHPSVPELADLFGQGHAAFIVNTGTLLEPTTKTQYLGGGHPLPPQLFSHADQQGQWQYGQPAANGTVGWGGLVADRLHVLNVDATIPISISLCGQNRYQAGASIQPYAITSAGPTSLRGYGGGANAALNTALQDLIAHAYPDPLTRTYASTFNNALDYYGAMTSALASAPPLATSFPNGNPLSDALKMIANVISVRSTLKAKRQIFFVSLGGFDTHDDMLGDQPGLFTTLSQALGAFHAATVELGVQNAVTAFTMSEFSRTLDTDGDGTDHAWGGTHLVVGGSVHGRKLYGTPAVSGGLFPDQTLDGPDCLPRGQMIPATSCDQYSATLARWLGVNDCDLATIFPYLANFPTSNLGFMG